MIAGRMIGNALHGSGGGGPIFGATSFAKRASPIEHHRRLLASAARNRLGARGR
jgi:hypothetical protein